MANVTLTPEELLAGLFDTAVAVVKSSPPFGAAEVDALIGTFIDQTLSDQLNDALNSATTTPPPGVLAHGKVDPDSYFKPIPWKVTEKTPATKAAEAVLAKAEGVLKSLNDPVTQKARGISALTRAAFQVPTWQLVRHAHQIATLPFLELAEHEAVFVRPCPTEPQHGFVDSRLVPLYHTNAEDTPMGGTFPLFDTSRIITQMFAEARAVDPNAELVVMQPIRARANLIIAPGMIAVGPGTDGATAGYGSIAIATVPKLNVASSLRTTAGIVDPDVPYFEVLATPDEEIFWVQMRGGPAPPDQNDFIPAPCTVTKVVEATGDLLTWKHRVETELRGDPGVVVNHVGGTPLSHYFVHCALHNVPILTTRAPKVGEVLEPLPTPPWDAHAFLEGFHTATMLPLLVGKPLHRIAKAMLFGLHHMTAMRGEQTRWIGMAVAFLLRLGAAACIGEWRHKNKKLTGDRDKVYQDCFYSTLASRARLPMALRSFGSAGWSSSYGGPAWADCTAALMDLDDAVLVLHHAKTPATQAAALTQVLDLFNVVVNKAHNGGWWLNKFVNKSVFDALAAGALLELPHAALGFWDAHIGVTEAMRQTSIAHWTKLKTLPRNAHAMHVVAAFREHGKVAAMELAKKQKDSTASAKQPSAIVGPLVTAQVKISSLHGGTLAVHLQYTNIVGVVGCVQYKTHTWIAPDPSLPVYHALRGAAPTNVSLAGSGTPYIPLTIVPLGPTWVLTINGLNLCTISTTGAVTPLHGDPS